MGRSPVDLPDPLDALEMPTPAGAGASQADDLLSQLAGDEIDRLLADANVEPIPAQPADLAGKTLPAAPLPAAPARDHDQAALALEATFSTTAMEAPASRDRVPLPNPEADIHPVELEMRRDLEASARVASSPHADDSIDFAPGVPAPVPWFLKPLEWVNAPLLMCPEPVRDAIGKAAMVTLFNAIAILVYVVIFRRHGRL